ncbi:universal stress protein [uncultured Friedmanniella sp.]|uniref:universal stress protein n=1 Tax=uncultured Friedmanniella sp. TaxID=335381 RepID=UPI0035CC38EB
MTVAVAHQVTSASNQIALEVAAREAAQRGVDLAVLHVVEALDLDVEEAYRQGLAEEVEKALAVAEAPGLSWQLHLGVGEDQVASKVLELAAAAGASILVIGARRRSPVGKFLLGSITQTLILEAEVPVLVVKPAP